MEKSAPEEVMKQWFSLGSQGFEQFQRFLWDSARNASGAATRKETPKSK